MAMTRKFALIAALCAVSACVPATPESPKPAQKPATQPVGTPADDSCKAAQFQGLIGQPRSVLAAMTLPEGTRIIGPRDAVTMDLRVDRLNFETDAQDRIAKIGCY